MLNYVAYFDDDAGMGVLEISDGGEEHTIMIYNKSRLETYSGMQQILEENSYYIGDIFNFKDIFGSRPAGLLWNIIRIVKPVIHNYVPSEYKDEAWNALYLSMKANALPGAGEIVECPACRAKVDKHEGTLQDIIIHLNDLKKWHREDIADWLDMLYADGVDLAFK